MDELDITIIKKYDSMPELNPMTDEEKMDQKIITYVILGCGFAVLGFIYLFAIIGSKP